MFFVVRSDDSFIFPLGWIKYIVIVIGFCLPQTSQVIVIGFCLPQTSQGIVIGLFAADVTSGCTTARRTSRRPAPLCLWPTTSPPSRRSSPPDPGPPNAPLPLPSNPGSSLLLFLFEELTELLIAQNQVATVKCSEGMTFRTNVLSSYLNIFRHIDILALTSFGYN